MKEVLERVSIIERKLEEFEVFIDSSIGNYNRQQDCIDQLRNLQEDFYLLKIVVNNIESDKKIKEKVRNVPQNSVTVQKTEHTRVDKLQNMDIQKPVRHSKTYSFLEDYYDMEDGKFKQKYNCKEMNFSNFSEVRNGGSSKAEFVEDSGNFYLVMIDSVSYLLPKKYFLENQSSRMVVSNIFDIDHENKGQLLAKQIISPVIVKRKDARSWICVEKGKMSQ